MWIKYGNKIYNTDNVKTVELFNSLLWLDGTSICRFDEVSMEHMCLCLKNDVRLFVIEEKETR